MKVDVKDNLIVGTKTYTDDKGKKKKITATVETIEKNAEDVVIKYEKLLQTVLVAEITKREYNIKVK